MNKKCIIAGLIVLIFLLAGCVEIKVDHKFKRNGLYDLSFTFESSNSMILSSMKDSVKVHESMKDKSIYTEKEDSFTYSFKNLDPDKRYKFFEDTNESQQEEQNTEVNVDQNPTKNLVDPKNTEFKKEFKFPYYVYTYRINYSPPQEPKEDAGSITDKYVIDKSGSLNDAQEKKILSHIQDIYNNDSVETIVYTNDKQLSPFDASSHIRSFRKNFSFQKENSNYLIIHCYDKDWMDTVNRTCETEENMYFAGQEFRNELEQITKKLEKEGDSYLVDAVEQLDQLSESMDLSKGQNQMQEQLSSLFKIDYRVETFGEIVETSGQRIGESNNKVRFKMNLMEENDHYLKFRDFFLYTWLGSIFGEDYMLAFYGLIAGVVVLLGAGVFAVKR